MLDHSRIKASGNVTLHTVTQGNSDHPPVLFLHGFPEYWQAWEKSMELLSGRGYFTAAVDLRGYNHSDKPFDLHEYTLDKLAADVSAICKTLSNRKVTLVGHDWGGAIAWAVASWFPDLIDKLIIINAPHPNRFHELLLSSRAQQKSSSYIRAFIKTNTEMLLDKLDYAALSFLFKKVPGFEGKQLMRYKNAWSEPGALTSALNYYRANFTLAPEDSALSRDIGPLRMNPMPQFNVTVPTLLIWGENDVALRIENVQGLSRWVPDLTVKRVPEASHWIVHEKTQLVVDSIDEFIRTSDHPSSFTESLKLPQSGPGEFAGT